MLNIKHQKTYTLQFEVTSTDSHYDLFRAQYDAANNGDSFAHTEEIFRFIESEVLPLVPFKKHHGHGFRLFTKDADKYIGCTITVNLSKDETSFI